MIQLLTILITNHFRSPLCKNKWVSFGNYSTLISFAFCFWGSLIIIFSSSIPSYRSPSQYQHSIHHQLEVLHDIFYLPLSAWIVTSPSSTSTFTSCFVIPGISAVMVRAFSFVSSSCLWVAGAHCSAAIGLRTQVLRFQILLCEAFHLVPLLSGTRNST